MIPVLFDAGTVNFNTMGIGVLSDATKVYVKRVLNGKDELELQYPIDGVMFNELINTRHILATPEYKKDPQAYTIYRVSKPMNGVVTVNARHISERKTFTIVKPFSFGSVTEMFNALPDYIVGDHPFTFYTDKSVTARCEKTVPASLGAVLGGSDGSALDVYGGEFEFDMFNIKLLNRRGVDHGVTVEYGKNLKKLEVLQAVDESVITGICPVWVGMEEGQQMYLPEFIVNNDNDYPFDRVVVADFSSEFDEKPTEEQLRNAATAYLRRPGVGVPSLSVKVTFEHLAQFEEYKSFEALEVLNLGDSVSIHHMDLDVNITARIVETVYDVLSEKYTSVTVGRVRSDMSTAMAGITKDVDKKVKENRNFVVEGVRNATDLITGAKGGYVVKNLDADGHPYEILIMDTSDKLTATNVIRINKNGIGFSTNGYNGPFNTAWTIDGSFIADFITAGTLNANVIRAGVISDAEGNNTWNLDTGEIDIVNGRIRIEKTKTFYAEDYSQQDVDKISQIILAGSEVEPTAEEMDRYDINLDGVINIFDLVGVRNMVIGVTDKLEAKSYIHIEPNGDHWIELGTTAGVHTYVDTTGIHAGQIFFDNVNHLSRSGLFLDSMELAYRQLRLHHDNQTTGAKLDLLDGLEFKNSSGVVTAKYNAIPTQNNYTASNPNLNFDPSGQLIGITSFGSFGIFQIYLKFLSTSSMTEDVNYTIYTLPVGQRPVQTSTVFIPSQTGGTAIAVAIKSDGTVFIRRSAGAADIGGAMFLASIPMRFI